ncbi:MAG: hypothetical protein Q8O89_02935 [Nanoarchaeota archaeon]|nr:hypothetical protein [Nanoarchaeota archaeon]
MENRKEKFKYSDINKDIYDDIFKVKYKGMMVDLSLHAVREMGSLGIKLSDVKNILETGFNCERSRRKEGTEEKCIIRGNKIIKVVAVRNCNIYNNEEVWLIIHVGRFSFKKRR